MAAAWVFKSTEFKKYAPFLAQCFRSWCETHNHRKLEMLGGQKWYLDEPPIFAVKQKCSRIVSDMISGNKQGVWKAFEERKDPSAKSIADAE